MCRYTLFCRLSHIYWCIPVCMGGICVYWCMSMYTFVYWCILVYTVPAYTGVCCCILVYIVCMPVYTDVYLCILLYTCIYLYILSSVSWCVPVCIHYKLQSHTFYSTYKLQPYANVCILVYRYTQKVSRKHGLKSSHHWTIWLYLCMQYSYYTYMSVAYL